VERCGSTDKHPAVVKPSAGVVEARRNERSQGRKSADFAQYSAAQEAQLLKAEKAVLAGELQKEKEMRIKMQNVRFIEGTTV
jgi:hypothetical protein